MVRLLLLVLLVSACTAQEPPLPLAERFEAVAFDRHPFYDDRLWRWGRPIRVKIIGSDEYRNLVAAQIAQLGEITGLPIELDSARPTMTIEFSRRNRQSFCTFSVNGTPGAYSAEIYIATDQPERHIRRCIAQELSQAMGLFADTDGRRDTAFSSEIGTDYLTEVDLALFAILYDRRLAPGMPREEVLAILPEIVADVEAAKATQSQ